MDAKNQALHGQITRLLSIGVPAVDAGVSAKWYRDLLGFTVLRSTAAMAEVAVVENGTIVPPTLILTRTSSPHRLNYEKKGRTRGMMMLHASDLEGLRERLLAAGATVSLPHADLEDDGCGRFFDAVDPAGNRLQVQANVGERPASYARVEAIFNLELPVADVSRSARFYAEVLGFHLIREPDDHLAIVKTGPTYPIRFGYEQVQEFGFFLFKQEERPFHLEQDGGLAQEWLVLQSEHIAALHDRLSREGRFEMGPLRHDHAGQFGFYMTDPDGNGLRLLQTTHANKAPAALEPASLC